MFARSGDRTRRFDVGRGFLELGSVPGLDQSSLFSADKIGRRLPAMDESGTFTSQTPRATACASKHARLSRSVLSNQDVERARARRRVDRTRKIERPLGELLEVHQFQPCRFALKPQLARSDRQVLGIRTFIDFARKDICRIIATAMEWSTAEVTVKGEA